MSYHVLARKWRPHNFQEMVGQEHVLRMLTNALDHQRLHHAYLFTGTRGVGKTTLARILAKCLNCEKGMNALPCGTCNTCLAIDAGHFLDLIEIDAASRTKVEDTREILDNVQYAPTHGRYKIYLIDEVHMLSGHSFNALLKTLEEPPSHVKFLLATTDPKKLPITILSRCLQFNLKRVPAEQIAQQLQHICDKENIFSEQQALNLLAKAADGSMRDALSLLDQTIAYCNEKITTDDTRQMLGTIEHEFIYKLLQALAKKDGKKLLSEISNLAEQAPDYHQVLDELLTILHQICVIQIVKNASNAHEELKQFAELISPEEIQLYYQIALIGRRDLMLTPNLLQGFEMIMLRMLAFQPINNETPQIITKTKPQSMNNKVETTQAYPVATEIKLTKAAPTKTEKTEITHITQQKTLLTENNKNNFAEAKNEWSNMLTQLELSGLAQALASNCTLESITENKIELALAKTNATLYNKKLADRMEQALIKYFNKPIHLEIKITSDPLHTPAKQKENEKSTLLANATTAIQTDNHVKKIIDLFDATLDVNSISHE